MARTRHPRRPAVAAAGVLAVGFVSIASAQQDRGAGGKTLLVSVGQSLRYSDNIDLVSDPDDSVLLARTDLGVAFSSVTRTQSFRLSFGGAFEAGTDGSTDLSDPYVRASYAIEGANSRLNASATYTRIEIDDAFRQGVVVLPGDDDEPISETARIEEGVRTDRNYTLGFETGLRAPVGFQLNLSSRTRRYSDTTSTNLFDSDTRRADALVLFRIDPQVTARVTASYSRYEAEDTDQTDRRETAYGVGVAMNVTPTLTLDASLRQQEIRTLRTSGDRETDGLAYGLDVNRSLRNGLIAVNFLSEPTLNNRRNTLRATRSMALRNDGALSYGVGVTHTEGLGTEPLFTLAYSVPLKRGGVSFGFSQEARTDEEDDEAVILTRVTANYDFALTNTLNWSLGASASDVNAREDTGEDRRSISLRTNLNGQISDISSWSAGLSLSDIDITDLAGNDSERRYGIQLAYRRVLAQDWDMVARYDYTKIDDSGTSDRSSNAISIGLEKTFAFRP